MQQLTTQFATRKIIADDQMTGKKKIFYLNESEFAGVWEDIQKRKQHIWIQGETFKPSQLKFMKLGQDDRDKIISDSDIVYLKDTFLFQNKNKNGIYLMQRIRLSPDKTETEIDRYYCGWKKGKEYKIIDQDDKIKNFCEKHKL